jgi:aquaporin NIP
MAQTATTKETKRTTTAPRARTPNLMWKAVAEAIGTFAVVFFGCGAAAIAARFPGSIPSGIIPVVFGLAVATMIYALGHISGAHFNPAVTLAFSIVRRFPHKQVPAYWLAQAAGAMAAIAAVRSLGAPH